MAKNPWEENYDQSKEVHTGISAETPAAPTTTGQISLPNEGSITQTSGLMPWEQQYQPVQAQTQPEERYSTQLLKSIPPAVGNLVTGAGKGALHTLAPLVALPGQVQGFEDKYLPKALTQQLPNAPKPLAPDEIQQMATPEGTAQNIGYGLEQAGEFMIPGGAEKAGAAKLAKLSPLLGKAAGIALPAIGGAAVNALQGGSPAIGAALGAAGGAVGEGLQGLAPATAESALRVRGNQRLFGRTVGKAVLEDTSGIRPESIARSAQQKIGQLEPLIQAADTASAAKGETGSLAPAREAVEDTMARHRANRAMGTVADIQPVADFLNTDQLTNQPLSEKQTALGLRAMKRGLNTDYIGKWSLDQPPAQKGAARKAYGELNQELHSLVPETKELDQRVSSLIPVVQQGQRVASGAPTVQRALGRFAVPTGALTLGSVGGFQGYREGGIPGAIAGGLTGILAPELIATPEGQMAAARFMHHAGGLRPLVGAASQLTPRKQDQQ